MLASARSPTARATLASPPYGSPLPEPGNALASKNGQSQGGLRATTSGITGYSKEETGSYLVVHKELRSFEVPRGHTDVVFLSWVVEFGQTPVYEPQLNKETQSQVPQMCR